MFPENLVVLSHAAVQTSRDQIQLVGDRFEAPVDAPTQASFDLAESLLDLIESLVDLVESFVDFAKTTIHPLFELRDRHTF